MIALVIVFGVFSVILGGIAEHRGRELRRARIERDAALDGTTFVEMSERVDALTRDLVDAHEDVEVWKRIYSRERDEHWQAQRLVRELIAKLPEGEFVRRRNEA